MKDFLAKHKKQIIGILQLILILALISVISVLILWAFNIVSFEGDFHFNAELFHSFKTEWYGWIIFILFQTVLSMLLCFIPGASMAFIILSTQLYEKSWEAFILSFVSVMISSATMYILGRYGGYKLCTKLLGEEDCAKALDLLRNKGTVYFPLMMMFPIFPDDALVMVAGTLRMSLLWFIPSIVIGRGIGIATIVFGFSIVPFDKFTSIWHWVGFILVCAILLFIVFYLAHLFNKKLEQMKHHND